MNSSNTLKSKIEEAMKAALKNQEKERLAIIRLILAEIKQKEIDERQRDLGLLDEQIIVLLTKMIKKRKDVIIQFKEAARLDLVNKENFEISVINDFLPPKISENQMKELVLAAIKFNNASSIKDMSKVMQYLKKTPTGTLDLEYIGKMVKDLLSKSN